MESIIISLSAIELARAVSVSPIVGNRQQTSESPSDAVSVVTHHASSLAESATDSEREDFSHDLMTWKYPTFHIGMLWPLFRRWQESVFSIPLGPES
jgi:hypothetical protein